MKIGVLTSSRADFSIYLPLLKKINNDQNFELNIIAFGTHLKKEYGYTVDSIVKEGFDVAFKIDSLNNDDSPLAISNSMGKTIIEFSELWSTTKFDLVFALGDRFEMFAAVASSIPFNIKIAHIHGGETTLGAIDNCFRHSITSMSTYHFVVAEDYKKRVVEIVGNSKNIFNVGSLSFDNLSSLKLLSILEFKQSFDIDLEIPSILITFHPETVNYKLNENFVNEIILALSSLTKYQQIITMPNADTTGKMVRKNLISYSKNKSNVKIVESFGTIGYLSCMKHCNFLLGNTSSGFAEAAYFPKWVINLGDRQKGRIVTPNILNVSINESEILNAVGKIEDASALKKIDIYGDGTAAEKIISHLKDT
jgi:GDP/UDP-N,N'-diacetylbacillosamine 2-epimerase (hydrolysing)